jgi:phosphopantothenoylcysteine decarboxylase/phosphopantothenate--cysteine ligase
MATLSGKDVVVDMFPDEGKMGTWHITLGMWGEAMIIAPASANTIAKIAHGFADNALTSLVLALRCPLLIAPAMDTDMYMHTATQSNIKLLASRGALIIPPDEGELASGLTGPGRLPDTSVLLEAVEAALSRPAHELAGRRILVTAGPTYEALDPVRYLGNHSSGRMGYAIAQEAARMGAKVTLVSGPVQLNTPEGVERIDVVGAADMHGEVMRLLPEQDVVIMAAAVADFTPATPSDTKIKKEQQADGVLKLDLVRTKDILTEIGAAKGETYVVGFALETDNAMDQARGKLVRKNADMIVMNMAGKPGSGFGTDTNEVTFLYKDGTSEPMPIMSKNEVARLLLERVTERITTHPLG